MTDPIFLAKLRGPQLQQGGVDVAGGRIGKLNFADSNVSHNSETGVTTVSGVPGGPSGVGPGTELGQRIEFDGSAWGKRRGGVTPVLDPTGATDSATALQAILNAAGFGQTVHVPWGKYRLASAINIPNGVTLAGSPIGHQLGPFVINNSMATAGYTGTTFWITHTGVAFTVNMQSQIRDIIGYYPTSGEMTGGFQVLTGTPVTTADFFIKVTQGDHGTTIKNITCINPNKFISIAADGPVGGTRIDNVRACAITTFIYLGRMSDTARVSNAHQNPANDYRTDATYKTYVQDHCDAFVIDGAEDFEFTGCFASSVHRGYVFAHTGSFTLFRGSYGNIFGGSIDLADACIHVVEPNGLTLRAASFHGVKFVGHDSSSNIVLFEDTHTAGGPDERPHIELIGCHGWNVHSRTFYMLSGSYGLLSVTSGQWLGAANGIAVNSSTTGAIEMDWVKSASGTSRTSGTNDIVDKNGRVLGSSTGSDRNGGHLQTAKTAAVSATNIWPGDGKAPKGMYRLRYTIVLSAAETGGSHTVTVGVDYDDALGSPTASGSAHALNGGTTRFHGQIEFYTDGAHTPQWKTTFGGSAGTGTPTYSIELQAERV